MARVEEPEKQEQDEESGTYKNNGKFKNCGDSEEAVVFLMELENRR